MSGPWSSLLAACRRRGTRAIPVLLLLPAACRDRPAPDAPEARPSAEAAVPPEIEVPRPSRVTLTAAAVQSAGILTVPVEAASDGEASATLVVPGQIEADPARVALISPRVAGRLEQLTAVVGDRVGRGDAVGYVFSAEYLTAQSDLALAARRAERLAATADSTGAAALLDAARRRLRLLGAPEAEFERLSGGGEPTGLLPLVAPFAGSLVESGALTGARVEAGEMVFRIVDLTEVDVVAAVPERALPDLRRGQRADVRIAAYPAERFAGVVERIRDELDATTRTVDAVLHVPNRRGLLRPGMFATVLLRREVTDRARAGVVVSETALVTDGAERIAFVEVGDLTYERRVVAAHPLDAPEGAGPNERRMLVTAGIAPGERVVVHGAFTLKSELGKSAWAEEE